MFENKKKIEITKENALVLAKFNPDQAINIAEAMLKKGEDEKIVEIFTMAPADTLKFIYKHPDLASKLASLIPEKIDEIINMADLPKDQLINLSLLFHEKMLSIAKINPDIVAKMFYEAMHNIHVNYAGKKDEKKAIEFIQKKISEIGQEYPEKIIPILKQMNEFSEKYHEAQNVIIEMAKFFPEKAAEIALLFKLEMEIAKAVPSAAAEIAIEKPELAFEIIKEVPESEKEIKKHFTMTK